MKKKKYSIRNKFSVKSLHRWIINYNVLSRESRFKMKKVKR